MSTFVKPKAILSIAELLKVLIMYAAVGKGIEKRGLPFS
jgi:hypothetical protein